MNNNKILDQNLILNLRHQIESYIIPAIEKIYFSGKDTDQHNIPEDLIPTLKYRERVVNFYDYSGCGISVLAHMAVQGNKTADKLVDRLIQLFDHYNKEIHGKILPGETDVWNWPQTRVPFHLAIAYERIISYKSVDKAQVLRTILETQATRILKHLHNFFPEIKRFRPTIFNNHSALQMQGVYHIGRVLGNTEWQRLARDGAKRFFLFGHPDGYWEEFTNLDREGGPSMTYTPLTASALYNILGGNKSKHPRFIKAGDFYRSLLNCDGHVISLADQRTNNMEKPVVYGLALHSLTPKGRGHIIRYIENIAWEKMTPEMMAVLHYDSGLMLTGLGELPEYETNCSTRLTLPIGIIRAKRFTAGLSAKRSLGRAVLSSSDYLLDEQNMVYLSHKDGGVILSSYKSKNDPEFSTFRRGADAFPIDTGTLHIGKNAAVALLKYCTFNATLKWHLGKTARLTLEVDDDLPLITTLLVMNTKCIKSEQEFKFIQLKGFSPYTTGNIDESISAVRFEWKRKLVVEFDPYL